MADILVRFNQAETDVQSWANLKARHLGFSEESLGFWFKQYDDTDYGDPVLVPSTIGQGMGRRVTQIAHGFVTKTLIRHNGSAWVKALATTDPTTLATHMVVRVLDANRFELSALGAWSLGGAPAGTYYLSETIAGALSSTEPVAGISQRVAVSDGAALHLTLSGGATSPSSPSGGFREAVLSIVKAPPSAPVAGDRHLLYRTPTAGTVFEGHGNHIATYNGSTWSYEIPSVGWAVIVKATGVPYFYTISGAWKPMYSGAGLTGFNDPTAYVSGEFIVWDGADAFDPETAGGRPPTGRAVPEGRVYGTAPATISGLKGYCGVGGRAAFDDGWAIFGFAPGGESIESNHGIMTFLASDDGPGPQSQGFLFVSGSGPAVWNELLYMEDGWGYQFHQLPSVALLGTSSTGKLVDATADAAATRAAIGAAASADLSAYQPLDSDLTAIAALSTTAFGRSLLTQADGETARSTIGAHPLEDQRLRTTDAVTHAEITTAEAIIGTWGRLRSIPAPAPAGYGGGLWPGGRTPAHNNSSLLVSSDGQVMTMAADDHLELQVGPPASRVAGVSVQWTGTSAATSLPETFVTKLHVNTDITLESGALHVGSDGDLIYTHPSGQALFNGNFLYSWTHQGGGDYSNLTVDSTSETTVIDETVQGRNGIAPVLAAGYLLAKGPLWVRVRGGYGVVGANPVLTVRVYLGSTVVGIKRIDLSTFTRTTENMGMSLLFWIEPLDGLSPGTNLRLRTHHYGQASKGLADSAGSFLLSEDETYSNIDGTVAQNLKVTAQWSALGSQTWAFFDGIEVYR